MSATISITTILSLLGLGIAYFYMKKVTAIPLDLGLEEKDGTRLKFIHGAIADGAMAFLKQEYKFLTIFMVVFAAIIAILIDDSHTTDIREGIYTALAFLFGGAISIASGYIGMKVATQDNSLSKERYFAGIRCGYQLGSSDGLCACGIGHTRSCCNLRRYEISLG